MWPGSGLHYREFLQSGRWEDWVFRCDGSRFSYWDEGYSQVEQSTELDLSYYIKKHPTLPLDALQRVCNNQDQLAVEESYVQAEEQDKWSEESAASDSWEKFVL